MTASQGCSKPRSVPPLSSRGRQCMDMRHITPGFPLVFANTAAASYPHPLLKTQPSDFFCVPGSQDAHSQGLWQQPLLLPGDQPQLQHWPSGLHQHHKRPSAVRAPQPRPVSFWPQEHQGVLCFGPLISSSHGHLPSTAAGLCCEGKPLHAHAWAQDLGQG